MDYSIEDPIFKKAVDEWTSKDLSKLDKGVYFKKMRVVVLPFGENVTSFGQTATPFTYKVRPDDTLKKISEYFELSYGELVNSLLDTNGDTTIFPGMDMVIPRHFIDLSKA